MRLHLINGNSTAAMTDQVLKRARAVAAPTTTVAASTPETGPASVEGYYDGALAVPGILQAVQRAEADGPIGAHIIACFDDPGLDAARSIAAAPVVGMCEAAIMVARSLAAHFTIVTDLPISVPPLEKLLFNYDAARICRRIRVAEAPVLALASGEADAVALVGAEIARAIAEEKPDAIILGCASLCELSDTFTRRFKLPVIDGIGAAVVWAEALARLGLATSRAGGYAQPGQKTYRGLLAPWAPREYQS
jgi:allantoin racemase